MENLSINQERFRELVSRYPTDLDPPFPDSFCILS